MKNKLSSLPYSNYPLFKGINQNGINIIMNCFKTSERKYKKGSYIWHAGDKAVYVGLLINGQVNIVKDDISGNRIIINAVLPSQTFGESIAISKTDEYPVSVQAAVDSVILLFDKEKLITPCTIGCFFHTTLVKNLLELIAKKNIALSERIECITKKNIKQKLVFYLVEEMKTSDNYEIAIPFNRKELSDYLNVNRSALSRVLSTLEEDKILIYSKNKFKILDFDKIKDIMNT
ncbi:MAG: Crp/Fnr family transcriptional regulator [Bacillota bacterium]|nr:Crp/Fnr family transcriptional regulator [Bacillota bacterium]